MTELYCRNQKDGLIPKTYMEYGNSYEFETEHPGKTNFVV